MNRGTNKGYVKSVYGLFLRAIPLALWTEKITLSLKKKVNEKKATVNWLTKGGQMSM